MMRGRVAPAGQSPAALRLRAHQQKMAARSAAARNRFAAQASTPWVPMGPAPLISDQGTYGAVSGRATSVAIDPSDATGNTLYVAGASAGVWKPTNATSVPAASVTWAPLTDQQASLVNGAVSVKPDGSVVLVGTGEPDNAIDSYYGVGILRSTNRGSSWSLIPSATGNNPALSFAGLGFSNFAWGPAAASTVVAATATTTQGFDDGDITSSTNRGLYYSSDSGQTWAFQLPQDAGVPISPGSISATDAVYNAAAGSFFAAIRYHGLYSSPNGQNWTRLANQPNPANLSTANCPAQIPPGGSTCPIHRGQLSVVPGRQEMYFWFVSLVADGGGEDVVDGGIWRSSDGGNSWSAIDETGIANCGDPGNNGCGVEQGYYNLKIAAVPDGQATDLYAGAVNLFKCQLTNGATTCATLDPNFPNQWINLTHVYGCSGIAQVHPSEHGLDFMLANGTAIMYFANDGGVYRTLDGFTKLDSGTCGIANGFDNLNASSVPNGTIGSMTQFVSFSLHPADQNTVLGGTEGNGSPATSSATGSPEWSTVNGGDGGYNAINAWTPNEWYTANPYVNIYACANGVNCTTDAFSLAVGGEQVGGDFGAYYTPYILDSQDPDEMIVGTCRVWRGAPTVPPSSFSTLSVDFDTLSPTTCTGDEINLVSALDASGPTADFMSTTVYATTEGTGPNAASPSGGEVWVTTNAGIIPMVETTGSINPSNYTISSVAADRSDPTGATAYVGIMGFNVPHVFQTNNAGANWSDWSGTGGAMLPDAPVNALLVDSSVNPSQVYAGTDVGLFVSSTTSPGWTEVGTPSLPGATGYLPNVPVTAIRMFNYAGTKKLRVSTYGRGIWEYALASGPDYTNVVSNTPQTVYASKSATFNGTLAAFGGYASSVSLTCAGAPPAACNLSQNTLTPTPSGATYTLTAMGAIGDYTFSAHGVGTDALHITHDAALTLHVVDFNISALNPATLSAPQGGTSNVSTFQVTAAGSFSSTVVLSCPSGLPSGAACAFSPSNSVNPTAVSPVTVTLTVTTTAGTPQGGPSTVTLSASVAGAPAAKTKTFTLTVTPPAPNFSLAITATPNSTVLGQNVTWSGTLTALNGYNTTVNLSCAGTPPGTCALNPSSLLPTAAGAPFTVTVGNATPATFAFNIQGTDGTLTHSQPVNLTVGTDVMWSGTGPTTATVAAGQSATYSFLAAPIGASTFSGTVVFACGNLPALTSCTFNPTSIAAGAGTTSVTLTLATTGPNQNPMSSRRHPASGAVRMPRGPGPASQKPRPLVLLWLQTSPIAGLLWIGIARPKLTGRIAIAVCTFALAWLLVLAGCGGALSGGGGTQSPVTVTVSPQNINVALNGQQQFTATVNNSTNQGVSWTVPGGSLNGTINAASGLYTAPAAVPAGAVTVTATSAVAGSTPGSATVTVTNPQVTVTVSPTAANVFANEAGNSWPVSATQQQFTATVSGGNSQAVTWAVTGGNANGTIDANGLYSSPGVVPTPSSVTVTATSTLATASQSATANIETPTALGTYPNIQVAATAAGGSAHSIAVSLTVD